MPILLYPKAENKPFYIYPLKKKNRAIINKTYNKL